jgi:uncharacterized protein involved in exopolysaccharide biosynthesis
MTAMRQLEGPVMQDPDTFDVRGALLSLYRTAILERQVIFVTCAVVLAVSIAYAIWWPPIFQAQATIMTEGDQDTARDSFYGGWSIFRKDDTRTESQLLTSGPVLKEVIRREKLGFNDVYHTVVQHLAYLWQTSLVGRTYHRFKRWLFSPGVDEPNAADEDEARTLAGLQAGVSLAALGEANMGVLSVRGPTRRVADIANTMIDVYFKQRDQRHREEAKKSVEALTTEAGAALTALRANERAKIAFMRQNGLGLGIEKEKFEVQKLADLEEGMADTRAKIAAAEASLKVLDAEIHAQPATRTVTTSYEVNALRETTRKKRLDLETSLVFARNRYRDDSPEVKDIEADIAGLDAILAKTSEKVATSSTDALNAERETMLATANSQRVQLAGLKASLEAMKHRSAQLRKRMIEIPTLEASLAGFDRDHKFAQEKYLMLEGKRAQATASMASLDTMPSVRVVSEATAPGNKSWPKPILLYPAALVFGLALGLALAVAKSVVLGRVRREQLALGRGPARYYGLVGVPAAAPRISVVMPGRLAPPKAS